MIRVVGVDPGLVHTGAVRFNFDPEGKRYALDFQVFEGGPDGEGPDIPQFLIWWDMYEATHTFVEAYKPRSTYKTDADMGRIVNDLVRATNSKKGLLNTGVKRVVRKPLMELLGAWTFSQRTHHQDLRSAARIGLYGMLKDPELNQVLYDYVTDHLAGNPWGKLKGGE